MHAWYSAQLMPLLEKNKIKAWSVARSVRAVRPREPNSMPTERFWRVFVNDSFIKDPIVVRFHTCLPAGAEGERLCCQEQVWKRRLGVRMRPWLGFTSQLSQTWVNTVLRDRMLAATACWPPSHNAARPCCTW
jgi:hypothetical protein